MPKSTTSFESPSQKNTTGASKNLAIVHDLFTIRGGGERLVLELVRGLGCDLTTGDITKDSFPLEKLPGAITNLRANTIWPGLKTWRLARAFTRKTSHLSNYYSVLYSGVAAPLAIAHHDNGRNVFYCHTPPRFLYDKQDHYLKQLPPPARWVLRALNHWFRPRYEKAVQRMDLVVANSRNIQARIQHYLGRDAVVVHPPCHIQKIQRSTTSGNFYLSTARLDPLKRVDVIVRAFMRMPDKRLVVASGGSELKTLKKMAAGFSNIHFTGWLPEEKYIRLLNECLATIYLPKDEDFGMSPVESMAAGKPVFCSDHGGLLETVLHNETGFYIDETRLEEALIEAIQSHSPEKLRNMASACHRQARRFDLDIFIQRMRDLMI